MDDYKKIILEIAKIKPSIILNAYKKIKCQSEKLPISLWEYFGWFDDVLTYIKNNQLLYARNHLRNCYYGEFDITDNEALVIVNDIKMLYTEPTIPLYMNFEKIETGYVIKTNNNDRILISEGTDKHKMAIEAWKWHGKHTNPFNRDNYVSRWSF